MDAGPSGISFNSFRFVSDQFPCDLARKKASPTHLKANRAFDLLVSQCCPIFKPWPQAFVSFVLGLSLFSHF